MLRVWSLRVKWYRLYRMPWQDLRVDEMLLRTLKSPYQKAVWRNGGRVERRHHWKSDRPAACMPSRTYSQWEAINGLITTRICQIPGRWDRRVVRDIVENVLISTMLERVGSICASYQQPSRLHQAGDFLSSSGIHFDRKFSVDKPRSCKRSE